MPKVSVIIPTYNRAEQLKLAIGSVLSQSFQDFEIIVVDDASRDNTPEVVAGFKNDRIRHIRHGTNKKISASRNTGILNSRGKYIAFLDDDDAWLPEKLEPQVRLLEDSPATTGAVYSGFYKIDKSSGNTLGKITPTKRGDIFQDLLTGNWIATSTVLLRKECFQKVGLFDESMVFGEDYDMWIRISQEFHFDYIGNPLAYYHFHDNNCSNNYELVIRGMESNNRKYEKFFVLRKKFYSDRYHSLGMFYCFIGNVRKGREAFLKAIRLYPFDVRYYFRLSTCLLGAEKFRKTNEIKERVTAWIKKC
jgi:glycosyltransferase involved in cell wall biosynthesis